MGPPPDEILEEMLTMGVTSSCDRSSPPEAILDLERHEITKFNYQEGLKEIIELVEIADFVAIDATVETAGHLMANEQWNPDFKEALAQRDPWGEWYDSIKRTEKSTFLLEVGIALFKRIPDKPRELECEVFNIPCLPACIDDNEMARFHGPPVCPRLKMNGYAKEFIESVKFDINKPFYMGVPFMNKELAEEANKYMMDNPGFMTAARKRRLSFELMPKILEYVDQKDRDEICERLSGVSKVFQAISNFRKPCIGHHLFLKLMFIYKDFFQYLPDTYTEYYDLIREKFPIMYDTKQLAENMKDLIGSENPERDRVTGKTLYELFRNINKGMQFNTDPNTHTITFSYRSDDYLIDVCDFLEGKEVEKDDESFCFEAGFDALISGLLFLDLVKTSEFSEIQSWPLSEDNTETNLNGNILYMPYTDYLDMFIKGQPCRFVNKLYEECPVPVPELRGDVTAHMTCEKKKMWFQKRKADKRDKIFRNRQLLFLASSGVGVQFTP